MNIDGYEKICKRAVSSPFYFYVFKRFKRYRKVLEHLNKEQGQKYLDAIVNVELYDWDSFKQNDKIGFTKKYNYSVGRFSPTTIRYVKTAIDIGKHDNIVEIGAGYGGQCLIMSLMHGFEKYHIIDLPHVVNLQKKYLRKNSVKNVSLTSYVDYRKCDLVISNYAWSELVSGLRKKYLNRVMAGAKHGYITVNKDQQDECVKELASIHDIKVEKDIVANAKIVTW